VLTDVPPIADTWTSLGAIAQATSTLLLGATVTPLPRRRPWVVAREASTVSRLSAGRLVLGVGLGSDEGGDFSSFGEPVELSIRSEMLDEGLGVMQAMWAGTALEHRGQHYSVTLPEARPEPHPIPIWSAASTTHSHVIRRAARCDGVFALADHVFRPDEVEALVRDLDSAAGTSSRTYDVVIAGNASRAWPKPHAVDLDALSDAGATWWMESLIHVDPLELSLHVIDAGPPSLT
jgi:alkanesulfonate monooxygenase SsuD/methylene tetrahydromethanopterin reductase-like flavin-dependent oxidoreductase (luciferase family)